MRCKELLVKASQYIRFKEPISELRSGPFPDRHPFPLP